MDKGAKIKKEKCFDYDVPINQVAAIIGFECALRVCEIVALDCFKVKYDRQNDEMLDQTADDWLNFVCFIIVNISIVLIFRVLQLFYLSCSKSI